MDVLVCGYCVTEVRPTATSCPRCRSVLDESKRIPLWREKLDALPSVPCRNCNAQIKDVCSICPACGQVEPIEHEAPGLTWLDYLKRWGPLGAFLIFAVAKLKWVLIALQFLKFGTFASMLLSIALYSWAFGRGIPFAVGFVLLIFVHELGHAIVMRWLGIPASAPVFIPFVGAVIAMRGRPRNASIEALVGIGGPALGTVGAAACLLVAFIFSEPLFYGLAVTGFVLNLFNLLPVSPLDGGRIVGGISRALWVVGYAIGIPLAIWTMSPILIMMLFLGAMTLYRLWQDPVPGYYDIATWKRWAMGGAYASLIAILLIGIQLGQHPFLVPEGEEIQFTALVGPALYTLGQMFDGWRSRRSAA